MKDNIGESCKILKIAVNSFPIGYKPTEDVIPELDPELASYYQSNIDLLQFMVKLGRIDINTEISILASHLALPREGHLEAIFNFFS